MENNEQALKALQKIYDFHMTENWMRSITKQDFETIRQALQAQSERAVDVEDFEEAKEIMKGAFVPDYDEDGIEHQQLWMQVVDELGIYPATVNDEPRTEWQTGWSEAVMEATSLMCKKLRKATPSPENSLQVIEGLDDALNNSIFVQEGRKPIMEAAQRYQALCKSQGGWRLIESAPKDGETQVILGRKSNIEELSHSSVGIFIDDKWWVIEGLEYAEPTHWMPLPTPPKSQGGA